MTDAIEHDGIDAGAIDANSIDANSIDAGAIDADEAMLDVLPEVEDLVRGWLAAADVPAHPSAARLAALLADPAGLGFAVGFVDRVIRPQDARVAAASLREIAHPAPSFLPWPLRMALRVGAPLSRIAPGIVVPVARRALRRMVGHLLIDASDARLGAALARLRADGTRLNINLLGEAVLGAAEASRRLDGTMALLARSDVDYVSIKVSSAVAPHSPWAFEQSAERIQDALLPLFALAAESADSPTPKFINLDMEEYRDLDLTIAVFTGLLDRPELMGLHAGIALQAYLPDALAAMIRLQDWAAARRARGGAGIKVRLVKGANLPMERVEASLRGWPLATWGAKQDTDANYKRVLGYALTPQRIANVRVGVAGHNLFDIAWAWTLAGRRGARDGMDVEMLLGMAEGQAEAVRETVGNVLLYVPVVHPRDFDAAIAYLVRRLEEGASHDNFLSAAFRLADDPQSYQRERRRFAASLDVLRAGGALRVPTPNRTQDRRVPPEPPPPVNASAAEGPARFANTPDTDPALPANRAWAAAITARINGSAVGSDLVAAHTIADSAALDAAITDTAAAGAAWGRRSGAERAAVLRRAAAELERRRADLLEAMASETGKTLDQGDPEVSEAIDFLDFYATLARELDRVDGAVAVPVRLTVVTPPWNFPVSITTGSVAGPLAAGSAVIVKPATQARRCGSLVVDALWAAGVPREALRLVHVDEGALGRQLIAHPAVDRVILTGGFETAQLFRSFRPDLPLLAETSGKNAIVVTPHADLDLAVHDLVQSAFGHAGQKCSAASLGILVGSVGRSRRFRDQLVDAVRSIAVGYPSDPTVQMGPIIEPASGKLLRALTQLDPGERWLVEPRRLDDTGRLWSPGVRTGVRRGSPTHLVEHFGPVLGLMAARDLDDAIAIQNEVDYGLTAGLHSLDRTEIMSWLGTVQAGNVYVNRGITGAVVRRQPFGGWKRSSVGAGAKAGGPNYLIGLTDWRSAPSAAAALAPTAAAASAPASAPAAASARAAAATGSEPLPPAVRRLLEGARPRLDGAGYEFLRRSVRSDAAAWWDEFGVARDASGLSAERNWLRYLPVPVTIRVEGGPVADLLRVAAAALAAGAPVRISTAEALDGATAAALAAAGIDVVVEGPDAWTAWLRVCPAGRIRLLGGSREMFAAQSGGRADLALYCQPVVEAGRVEMLAYLHEQAVSVTAHRFGTPSHLVDSLL